VIRAAKRPTYNKQVSSSDNKLKTTWQIIHSETGGEIKHGAIQHLIACKSISHKKTKYC
jgi:hypothetical protein